MKNLGDFTAAKTVRCFFNTRGTTGAPITLAGTPAISVYKDGGTTESTAGVTLTTDFDSRTGLHLVAVDTSADGTFYSAGSDFNIVITTGTVDSISVVGVAVGVFSIANRSALMPTTAGRTLDVSAGGEAGLDWANVGSPTTSLALTGTTISTSQVAASVTAGVTVTTNNDKTGYALSASGLSSISAWTVAITGNITGNLSGSVGSVTAGVTVTTNNDKTGYSLAAGGLAAVTAWTVAITGNITGNLSGSVGSVTGNVGGNVLGNVAGSVASVTATVSADLVKILTYSITQSSSSAIASAFTKFFDVASATPTINCLPNAVPGAAGGLQICGSNAATSYASLTANLTGNVSGSVGSVTGAVASVTGNVGGNVTGTVASVVGAVGSVTGNVGGNVAGSVASVTGLNAALLDVAVSTRSTYAGADTAGTTTLLARLTSTRAGLLDNLANLDFAVSNINDAISDVPGNVWGYGGGRTITADTAGTTTLLSRLTSQRAGWLDNLQFLDMSIIDARDVILGDIPSAGAVATAVWANGTRTLSAFAFSVTVGTNNDKTGYSLASGPPTAADIWTYGTRTLTSGGGGSGGATVEEITAALEPIIAGGSFTLADRETLGHALTLEQFTALK